MFQLPYFAPSNQNQIIKSMFVLFNNIPSEIEVLPRYKLLTLLPLLPPNALLTLPIYDITLLLYGLSGPEQNVGLESGEWMDTP